MNSALKIILGLLLIVIGLGLFADLEKPITRGIPVIGGIHWLRNFGIVVTGVIPPLLILVGLFVVWLEADELKMQRELKEEEEKEKKRQERKKLKRKVTK